MSDNVSRPELVIAIDFGMTCMICLIIFDPSLIFYIGTGVAFCNIATGEENVRWLQKWPGRSSAVENKVLYCHASSNTSVGKWISINVSTNQILKVPTVLVYPKNSTTPSSWGFLSETSSEQMSDNKECKEWFKTFLDEDRLLQARRDTKNQDVCPESIQEVERL